MGRLNKRLVYVQGREAGGGGGQWVVTTPSALCVFFFLEDKTSAPHVCSRCSFF